jgi:hypothetical protein
MCRLPGWGWGDGDTRRLGLGIRRCGCLGAGGIGGLGGTAYERLMTPARGGGKYLAEVGSGKIKCRAILGECTPGA